MGLTKDLSKVSVADYIKELEQRTLAAECGMSDVADYYKGMIQLAPYLVINWMRKKHWCRRFMQMFKVYRQRLAQRDYAIKKMRGEIKKLKDTVQAMKQTLQETKDHYEFKLQRLKKAV